MFGERAYVVLNVLAWNKLGWEVLTPFLSQSPNVTTRRHPPIFEGSLYASGQDSDVEDNPDMEDDVARWGKMPSDTCGREPKPIT